LANNREITRAVKLTRLAAPRRHRGRLALSAAVIASALVAAITLLPPLRIGSFYFALATLGVNFVFFDIFRNLGPPAAGADGTAARPRVALYRGACRCCVIGAAQAVMRSLKPELGSDRVVNLRSQTIIGDL